MNEVISLQEFNNNPIYEDMKIGDILHIGCDTIGKRPYRCAECYPHEVMNIQIDRNVKITYRKI